MPPRSACVFCPLKSIERWQETLEETPGSFEDAVKLEHLINVRQTELGRDPIFLTRKQIPLANLRQQWLVNGHHHGDDQGRGALRDWALLHIAPALSWLASALVAA